MLPVDIVVTALYKAAVAMNQGTPPAQLVNQARQLETTIQKALEDTGLSHEAALSTPMDLRLAAIATKLRAAFHDLDSIHIVALVSQSNQLNALADDLFQQALHRQLPPDRSSPIVNAELDTAADAYRVALQTHLAALDLASASESHRDLGPLNISVPSDFAYLALPVRPSALRWLAEALKDSAAIESSAIQGVDIDEATNYIDYVLNLLGPPPEPTATEPDPQTPLPLTPVGA